MQTPLSTADFSASVKTLTKSDFRTLGLATLGGALEFYDFIIFVFFANPIGQLFFPAEIPDWLRQFQTFGPRPSYDERNRKQALIRQNDGLSDLNACQQPAKQ